MASRNPNILGTMLVLAMAVTLSCPMAHFWLGSSVGDRHLNVIDSANFLLPFCRVGVLGGFLFAIFSLILHYRSRFSDHALSWIEFGIAVVFIAFNIWLGTTLVYLAA
jgi:hypothetical protein